MGESVHNFHLPLPETLYQGLREEAARSRQPATLLARQAIAEFVRTRRQAALHEEIAAYAREAAGTEEDLDPELEAAGVESLLAEVHL